MANNFDINSGLLNVLRGLLHDENFACNIIDLLLGHKKAPWALEHALKQESYGQTLNEVVAVHRLMKKNLNETSDTENRKDKGLLRKIFEIRKQSMKFQTQVIVKTLKKPGAVPALIKLIASEGTDAKSWAVLAPMVVDSAVDVASENPNEISINESAISSRLRRMFKHGSHSKSMLSEGIDDRYDGRIPVNVYVGRFQPFHLGHLSNLEEAAKRGLRTVICPVMKGATAKSIKGHPFDAIDGQIFEKLKAAYGDLIIDVIPIKNPFLIDTWLPELRAKGYEPIAWTTGEDRAASYKSIIEANKEKLGLDDNFELIVLAKNMGVGGGSEDDTKGIEGRVIRQCLVDGDEEGFRRQMPKCLWDMYDTMRQIMVGNTEPAVRTVNE